MCIRDSIRGIFVSHDEELRMIEILLQVLGPCKLLAEGLARKARVIIPISFIQDYTTCILLPQVTSLHMALSWEDDPKVLLDVGNLFKHLILRFFGDKLLF